MHIFSEIVGVSWLIFIIFWFISAFSAKKNVRGSEILLFRIVFSIVVIFLVDNHTFGAFIHTHSFRINNLFINILGALFCIAGVALAIWARVNIGKNWGMPMSIKEEPELVTSGPYNYIRHPIYSGVILAALGSLLAVSGWWLVAVVAFFIYFGYSAKKEEKNLTEIFPTQYPQYMKRTKMLVPFVV